MTANIFGTNYNKLAQFTVPQANSKCRICLEGIIGSSRTKEPDTNENLVIWCSDDVFNLSRQHGRFVANEDGAVALVTSGNRKCTAMHCVIAQTFCCARNGGFVDIVEVFF